MLFREMHVAFYFPQELHLLFQKEFSGALQNLFFSAVTASISVIIWFCITDSSFQQITAQLLRLTVR